MNKENITGVILAGGKSSRMGSDKGLLEFRGSRMVERIVVALKPQVNSIMIISNSDNYDYLGYPVYRDLIRDCGPMGGIFTALSYSKTDGILVVSCDLPLVRETVFKSLVEAAGQSEMVIPVHGTGQTEPLCAIYRKTCAATFGRLLEQGNWKIKDSLKYFNVSRIDFSDDQDAGHCFFNVNTPSEYQTLKQIIHEHSS